MKVQPGNVNSKFETASAPSSAPEDLRTHSLRGRKFSAHVRVLAGQMPNLIGVNKMGFFAMIASMLLGIFFIVIGLSRRQHKGWSIILITLGIVFVLIAVYLGFPK